MVTAGWYVRLLRDEVLAEWQLDGASPALHVHCHVSGQERWLAPPHLRNYIFKREMALVRRQRRISADRARCAVARLDHGLPGLCLLLQSLLIGAIALHSVTLNSVKPVSSMMTCSTLSCGLQVLDTLAYAERELLEAMPAFKRASVLVHLQSDVEVWTDTSRSGSCFRSLAAPASASVSNMLWEIAACLARSRPLECLRAPMVPSASPVS